MNIRILKQLSLIIIITVCNLENYCNAQIVEPGVNQLDYKKIQNSLNQKTGPGLKVIGIVNFDSAETAEPWIFEKPVKDPYGTLKNCYLFFASGDFTPNYNNNKGERIGIYKDDHILWLSNPLVIPVSFTGGKFYGSLDLNKDHKVDIIISIFSGNRSQIESLLIFSWNGSNAKLIVDVDTKGHSKIIMQRGTSELIDIESNGILEITGKNLEGKTVVYSWNGQKYGNWGVSLPEVLPRNHFKAQIHTHIYKKKDLIEYYYIIHNQAKSLQSIEQFAIKNFSKVPNNVKGPNDWGFNAHAKFRLVSWQVKPFLSYHPNALIIPGETDSSYRFSTIGLPRPATFYLKGNNGKLSFDTDELLNNSVQGTALGPYIPPNPFDAGIFTDTLRSFASQACNLKWIDNKGICQSLQAKLKNVQKQLSKGKTKTAINDLNAFLNEVEAQKSKHLTSEGYGLLYYNGEYLLKKLRE